MRIEDYPIGTKAYAVMGGYWEKTVRGWKWCVGATFPRPGGDVVRFETPNNPAADKMEVLCSTEINTT